MLRFQEPHLFQNGSIYRRVAALNACHRLSLANRCQCQVHNLAQVQRLAAMNLGAGLGKVHYGRVDEGVGVYDNVGGFNHRFGF